MSRESLGRVRRTARAPLKVLTPPKRAYTTNAPVAVLVVLVVLVRDTGMHARSYSAGGRRDADRVRAYGRVGCCAQAQPTTAGNRLRGGLTAASGQPRAYRCCVAWRCLSSVVARCAHDREGAAARGEVHLAWGAVCACWTEFADGICTSGDSTPRVSCTQCAV